MPIPALSRRLALALLAALVAAVPGGTVWAKDLPTDSVVVKTRAGGTFRFTVELARSAAEQQRGLMFRQRMADDAGMLFLYDSPVAASFWMKNTLIPLDMIFIARDGTIANIQENAAPHDLTPKRAARPVTGVLEINGGLSAKLGIRAGDTVEYKSFK